MATNDPNSGFSDKKPLPIQINASALPNGNNTIPLESDTIMPPQPLRPALQVLPKADLHQLRIEIGALYPRRKPTPKGTPKRTNTSLSIDLNLHAEDDEDSLPVHPRSWYWAPRGMPDGLYRDVIRSRCISQSKYYFCTFFYSTSLILQLIFSATVTALSSRSNPSDTYSTVLTVIAAVQTVNAGLMALMHNSGLPDRFRNDWNEFDRAEMFIRELVDTGIVEDGVGVAEAAAGCYLRYTAAKQAVRTNRPSVYNPSTGTGPVK